MKNIISNVEIWDNVANTYEIEVSDAEKQLAEELCKMIREIGLDKGAKLIELGCGSGHLSAILAKEGYDVTLLDFSEVALKKAKRCFENLDVVGKFIKGDLFDLNNIDNEYDLVWNSGVMEHFDDGNLKKAMESITSISAKYYMFLVPNSEALPYLLMRYKAISTGEWIWGKEYLRTDYEVFMKSLGYETFKINYMGQTFAEDQLRYVLQGCLNNFPIKEMINDKTISKNQSYLKTYVFSKLKSEYKDNINLGESKHKHAEYKTEIFDLRGEVNRYSILNNSLQQKLVAVVNEKDNIINDLKIETDNLVNNLNIEKDELTKSLESEKKKSNSYIKKLNRISEIERTIKEIQTKLIGIAHTKPFRLAYFARRFKFQFVKGNIGEKRKFLRWILGKSIGSKEKCEYEYNLLMNTAMEIDKCFNDNTKNLYTEVMEKKYIGQTEKEKSLFIFASVPYYDIGGGQRSAQLAKTFDNMGYSVHYIYTYEACDGSNNQNIHIPCFTHKYIGEVDEEYIASRLTKESIFIFELPHIECEKYLHMAGKYSIPVVYEHIDNWETSLGSMFFSLDTYRKFINKSNILIATSKLLQEKLESFIKTDEEIEYKDKRVEYLPNAVDNELFEHMIDRKMPEDLVKGKKTLLYYGSLWGEWFDWELIRNIANKKPEYAINLIGDYEPVKNMVETLPSNIHFLGLKKQRELPAYLKYSDIALIPFKNDEIGKYVSPLKIFEYICAGKIVVSTDLPDIKSYPNVYASDDKEEWVKLVSMDYEVDEFDAFITENSWYSRCRYILEKAKAREEDERISVIVLNRNNKKVIGRCIETLIKHNTYGYEVIVIDNQSTDGSFEMLEDRFCGKIKLIRNEKNGCSSGRNLGVRNALGNHIVFLDSDQWVLDDKWLDNALDIIRTKKDIGAVGWSAGWFNKDSAQGPIVDYFPNRAIKPGDKFRKDVAYIGTGGLIMKKSLFEKINGFDEKYDPTCFEDTDLSLKIRHEGYEIAYCPYINIFHLPHQTTNSGSPEHIKRMKNNGEYFMSKWSKLNPKLLQYYYKEC